MFRALLAGVAIALSANELGAQITTYVAPPRRDLPSPQAIATADSLRRDSLERVAITNMKTWVDSAAGVAVPPHVGAIDTLARANDPGRPVTTFSDGAVAPATASDLPALAIAGALVFAMGLVLLTNRPRG